VKKRPLTIIGYTLFGLILLANVLILASGKTYIYTTLIHLNPDLDDYKIFANREVQYFRPQPWPLAVRYNKKKLPDSLDKELKALHTTAFLVIKNDSLVYESYDDGGGQETISNSFSVAKSVVSILTGIALKEGRIGSLDEPVGDFLPEFKEGEKSKVTIRHLLTMSSGLDWDEAYSSLFSETTEAYYGTNLAKLVSNRKLVSKPGTVWSYKTIDVQLLSMVLHKATGKTISDYASEKLWPMIGAEHKALWSLDHSGGDEKAYCCFNATARDFARIGKLYMDSGRWNGQQLVPANYVALSTRANMIPDETGDPTDYYGYLWWLMQYKDLPVFYARGIKGQYVMVVPSKNIIIVRLGEERSNHVTHNHHLELEDMIAAALEM